MDGILFDSIIFGPVISRRLGISLGINLLPTEGKICNFDCIYCECGWTIHGDFDKKLPSSEIVISELNKRLTELKIANKEINNITFAGNGEPTMHPQFATIVDGTILLRNELYPDAKISVLSNSTLLHKDSVFNALKKIENNIMKLDAGSERVFNLINQGTKNIHLNDIVSNLKKFNGKLKIQTLFIRGEYNDQIIDNTTEEEIALWLKHIEMINPESVMLYSFDRETPAENLEKISKEELNNIAKKLESIGIKAEVF